MLPSLVFTVRNKINKNFIKENALNPMSLPLPMSTAGAMAREGSF